jgi:hypothetical protein
MVRQPDGRLSQNLDLGQILYLQRTAGNAAVASLFESRRAPASVQRCAGRACDCPPEERQTHDAAPFIVQRGLLDTLTGAATALLPDSIRGVLTGTAGHANAQAGELKEQAGQVTEHAQTRGAEVLDSSTATATKAASKTEGRMRSQSVHAESLSSSTVNTANLHTAKTATATTGLQSIGSYAMDLVNPVGPLVALPEFQQAVHHVGSVLAAIPGGARDLATELEAAVTGPLKAGQGGGWNCDQAEIMAMAGGVERAVTDAGVKAGKKVLGDDRYDELAAWTHERVANLKEAAAAIRAKLKSVSVAMQAFWTTNVAPLINRLQGLMKGLGELKKNLVANVGHAVDNVKKFAEDAWTSVRTKVIDPVVTFAHKAKEAVTKLVTDARVAIGHWWDNLPDIAKSAILGLGAAIAGPFALALAGAERAEHALAGLSKVLGSGLKAISDGVLKSIATMYQGIRKRVIEAVKGFKKKWKSIKQSAREFLGRAYGRVDAATAGRISGLIGGLRSMKSRITGAICSKIGAVAGPCMDQFVPNSIKDKDERDVTLTTNASVTVPVYGVPVKVGEGATVRLSREGKTFTVRETGEALIVVAAPSASKESVSLDVGGLLGPGVAWKKLTGNGPAPAPAAPAGAPGEAKKEGGPEVEAEAGFKGTTAMDYSFEFDPEKDKTCDGLGGLVAFLGAQGLTHVVPPPFGAFASGAVEGSYADRLTGCIVTLAEYGKASVNLKKDGIGGLEAAIKGENKVSAERKLDKAKGWVDTAKISEEVGVTLGAKLAAGGDIKLNLAAEGGVTGTLFAELVYEEKKNEISALKAGAKLAFSLEADPAKIQAVFPSSVARPILASVQPYLNASEPTGLEVEAEYAVEDLDQLLKKLDKYFNDPNSVSTEGLADLISEYMSTAKIKMELKVKMKTTRTLATAKVGIDAKEAGGKASMELAEHRTRTIYQWPIDSRHGD